MATIRQLKTMHWQAVIRRQGLPNQYKTFVSQEDAIKWARGIETEIDRGVINNYSITDKVVFSKIIARYQLEITPEKKSAARELSRLKCLNKHFGELILPNITPTRIALFRDLRLSEGLSGSTVIKDINTLSHIIDIARKEWGYYLPSNPTKLIRKPKNAASRIRRLSSDEEKHLLKVAKKSKSLMMYHIIIFAIETGMRLGEIIGLEWADISKSIAYIYESKNGESREVPLSKKALLTINKLPKHFASKRIFWKWKTTSGFQSSWQRLIKRSEINNLHFHDLRHEAISRLFEKGLNPMEVSAISGHKSMQVLKRYTHIKTKYLLKKINKV